MYHTHTLTVNDSPMTTLLFEPEGTGPHTAPIIAQHLPVAHAGLEKDPFTIDIGERYAAAGYVWRHPLPLPLVAAGGGYGDQARTVA